MGTEAVVHVVDDDDDAGKSLKRLIESAGYKVSTHATTEAFLDQFASDRPGCLLLDLPLQSQAGPDLQERLTATGIHLPVIVIAAQGDVALAVRAMRGGAVDFIERPFDNKVLLDRIRQAIDLDSRTRGERHERAEIASRIARLTRREREVLDAVVLGYPNKKIARELGISSKTVEAHRAHVMDKMQADSLAELVRQVEKARANLPFA